MKTKILAVLMLLVTMTIGTPAWAQVTVGADTPPQDFSVLEIISNTKGGLRLPQLTTAQRDALTASADFKAEIIDKGRGLTIYNTTTNCTEYWNKVQWVGLCDDITLSIDPCDKDGDGFLAAGAECGGGTPDPDDNDPCNLAVAGLSYTASPSLNVEVGVPVIVTVTATDPTLIKNLSLNGGKNRIYDNKITITPGRVGANTFTITVNNCPSQTIPVTITATTCTAITSVEVASCLPYMFTYQTMDLTATKTGGNALSYQWYVDGAAVEGETGSTFAYTPGNLGLKVDDPELGNMTKTAKIKCEASNACGTVTSNEYEVQVVLAMQGQLSPIYVWAWNADGTKTQKTAFAHVNLGAENALNPCDMLGDLYQWGRSKDGHQLRTSATTPTLSDAAPPGHGDFIIAPSSPYNWLTSNDITLWGDGSDGYNQAKATANDPCPAGWKVPSQKQWGAIVVQGNTDGNVPFPPTSATANRWEWTTGKTNGYMLNDIFYLPAAGYRFNGTLYNLVGNYWSSTVYNSNSYILSFSSSINVIPGSSGFRANGLSVRCIQE